MVEGSDAFISLSGGYGTMEEFMEMITWQQLGYFPQLRDCEKGLGFVGLWEF